MPALTGPSTRTGAGVRKAPTHEIAGREWRWRRNYGDFAAGSGSDVVERSGSGRDIAASQVFELFRKRAAERLCDAIMRFRGITNGDFEVTKQRATLSAESQHKR